MFWWASLDLCLEKNKHRTYSRVKSRFDLLHPPSSLLRAVREVGSKSLGGDGGGEAPPRQQRHPAIKSKWLGIPPSRHHESDVPTRTGRSTTCLGDPRGLS